MDAPTQRITFRLMLRGHVAAILLAHIPGLLEKPARDMAVVVVQLMKAASALSDEEDLPGRATGAAGVAGVGGALPADAGACAQVSFFVALHHQGRDRDRLQIVRLVCLRESLMPS